MGCYDRLIVPKFSPEEIADTVKSGRLLTMEIEFNRECNYHCIYCYVNNKEYSRGELTRDELKDVIDQAGNLGVTSMVVLGGEPMLYPHLMEMLRYIRDKGMEVELFTNGSNMTEEAARKLFGMGVRVVLKMNSFKERTQDLLSGKKGAYRHIQSAFGNLKAAGYPGKEKWLGISTVICDANYDELERLWRWLREQDITPYFEMITPQGKAKKNTLLYVEPQRIQDMFYRLSEIDREFGFDWTPQPPLAGMECLRHQFSCVVNSHGEVYPCVGVDIPVGNIREKRLADIISGSEVMQKLRNYKENIKGPCRECEDLSKCYGCRGAAYNLTGDYLASDPLCWKNNNGCDGCSPEPSREMEELVPHRRPMLMVERLLEVDEDTVVEAKVSEDMIFVGEDGALDDVAFIEMVAQAMAAREGYVSSGNGGAPDGFLIGAKDIRIHGTAFVGDTLRITIRKVAQYGPELAVIRGEVFNGETRLAEGEIKVWQNKGKSAA